MAENKILVIGSAGQVGNALINFYATQKCKLYSTHFRFKPAFGTEKELDISDRNAVFETIKSYQPDLVYLPAALSNVDYCEINNLESRNINVGGVKNVVDAMQANSTLVFYSTDFVFDGKEGLYDTISIPNPINEYGKQKLIAENYIMSNLKNYRIIRTNCVFGHDLQRKNFLFKILNFFFYEETGFLQIPCDEWITPTYIPDLVTNSHFCVENLETGIYHITGNHITNRYKFALDIAREFSFDLRKILPIKSEYLNRKARRPLNGGLKCSPVFTFRKFSDILNEIKNQQTMFKKLNDNH